MSDAFMFKDKLAKFSHRREVIFTHVYLSNEIGAKLIKWLCVSCLATLNYSCLFDCCVWRIYWEVVHQRANPCLGCCSSNSTGKVPFTVCEVTLNSHWGILICLFSSLFFIILHLCLYLWPCSTCLLSICQIFFFFFFCSFTRLVILVWSQCQHHLICLHILSVDHDWCLLATAFNSFDWVPPKNKRRFSFETLKLSSSHLNDSFSVLKSASPTLTRLFLAAGQRGSP